MSCTLKLRYSYKFYLSINENLKCNFLFWIMMVFIPTLISLKNFRIYCLACNNIYIYIHWKNNSYSSQIRLLLQNFPSKKFQNLTWGCWLDFIASEIYVVVPCHKQKTEAPFLNFQHCWHFRTSTLVLVLVLSVSNRQLHALEIRPERKIQPQVSAVNCTENRRWQQSHFCMPN